MGCFRRELFDLWREGGAVGGGEREKQWMVEMEVGGCGEVYILRPTVGGKETGKRAKSGVLLRRRLVSA